MEEGAAVSASYRVSMGDDEWTLALLDGRFTLRHDHSYRESDGPYCWNLVTDTRKWEGTYRRADGIFVLEAEPAEAGFALIPEGRGRYRLAWRPPGLAGALGEGGRAPFDADPPLTWVGEVVAGTYADDAWDLRLDAPDGTELRGAFRLVHDAGATEPWEGSWHAANGVVHLAATAPRAARFSFEWLGETKNAVRGLPGVPGGEPTLRRVTPRPEPPR